MVVVKLRFYRRGLTNAERWFSGIVFQLCNRRNYQIVLRRLDVLIETWVSPADPSLIRLQLKSLSIIIEMIVYESDPTGYGLARELISVEYNVKVAAPSRILRSINRSAKTDCLDYMKLADYAAKHILRSISIPSEGMRKICVVSCAGLRR